MSLLQSEICKSIFGLRIINLILQFLSRYLIQLSFYFWLLLSFPLSQQSLDFNPSFVGKTIISSISLIPSLVCKCLLLGQLCFHSLVCKDHCSSMIILPQFVFLHHSFSELHIIFSKYTLHLNIMLFQLTLLNLSHTIHVWWIRASIRSKINFFALISMHLCCSSICVICQFWNDDHQPFVVLDITNQKV